MASYLVAEEDGTSKLILEEGGGDILTEESVADTSSSTPANGPEEHAAIHDHYYFD